MIGYRKLVVGNRDWQLIWRATTDDRGTLTVEIAEVWAIGARSDGEVYGEMGRRVSSLGDTPVRKSLEAVVGELGTRAKDVSPTRSLSPHRCRRGGSSNGSSTRPASTAMRSSR